MMILTDYRDSEMLFATYDLRAALDNNREEFLKKVEDIPDKLLKDDLATNQTIESIFTEYKLEIPKILEESIYANHGKKQVDVSKDPNRFVLDPSKPAYVTMTTITFHLPFSGQEEMFHMRASTHSLNPPRAKISNRELLVTYLFENDIQPDEIKTKFQQDLKEIGQGLDWINSDTASYNTAIQSEAKDLIEKRKLSMNSASILLEQLGFPSERPEEVSISDDKNDTSFSQFSETSKEQFEYDFFISYATEDKEHVARPIYDRLIGLGYRVWFDDSELRLGDSLKEKITAGLTNCRFGVVILSPRFFEKNWPKHELNVLWTRRLDKNNAGIILPIWHGVKKETLMKIDPGLADIKATNFADGIEKVIEEIKIIYPKS